MSVIPPKYQCDNCGKIADQTWHPGGPGQSSGPSGIHQIYVPGRWERPTGWHHANVYGDLCPECYATGQEAFRAALNKEQP